MIQHLIFDFDGVIGDTFSINWPLSKEHDPSATMEDFLAHHDGNVYAEPRIKFKPERMDEFWEEYGRRLTPAHLSRSVEPLKRLHQGRALYVVSSSREQVLTKILEEAGVLHLFTRIMGGETHPSKTEKFKMLVEQSGVTPENSLFITDTLGDIKEATKAGIRTIAVTFGFHPRERLTLGAPLAIVDSWEEVEKEVEGL